MSYHIAVNCKSHNVVASCMHYYKWALEIKSLNVWQCHARIQNVLLEGVQLNIEQDFFLVDEGCDDPNTTKSVSLMGQEWPKNECWLGSCDFPGDPDQFSK